MHIAVADAVALLESRGVVERRTRDDSAKVIELARGLITSDLPKDLEDFYRANIKAVGDYQAVYPTWNDRVGWKGTSSRLSDLLHVQAVPIVSDGCGNLFGLDLSTGAKVPAVYLFDHEREFEIEYAAGSSLGAFLLVLAETDQSYREGWPAGWQRTIDPDIDNCPRARAVWASS